MTLRSTLLIFLFYGLSQISVQGQQLTYQPVNPNFGGNPMNYSGLLASADAQDPFKEDNLFDSQFDQSPLGTFSDSVKRQVLNQLSGSLLGNGTGGDSNQGINPGTTEVGGLVINIENTRRGSVITIIDSGTGESTEIFL